MRYLAILILALFASTASAGSIRPAACVTTTQQDTGIKDYLRMTNAETCARLSIPKASCTDAAAKAIDPTATVYDTISISAYQSSTDGWYCATVTGQAAAGTAWRNAKNLQELYAAASPAVQAQVNALLGVAP